MGQTPFASQGRNRKGSKIMEPTNAWQPIETAPKDYYEQVIGYAEGFGVVPMAYANNMWHILEIPIDGYVDHNTECNPTHWMPLPSPPKENE